MKAGISINIGCLSDSESQYLRRLGLSDHELQTYQVLVDCHKPMSAQDVSRKLMVLPNAVYRIFRDLERIGLVRQVATSPIKYSAAEKSKGFEVAYQQEKSELARLLRLTGATNGEGSHEAIITGRNELYQEYIRLASDAKREISVFAIGIAYSEQLYKTQETAIKRGVYIKHVVQKLKPSNYHIISKWQRLGVNVRHNNQQQGYHITIIDREVALVTFSNPSETDDRLTIVTKNPTAVALFQLQFDALWATGRELNYVADVV